MNVTPKLLERLRAEALASGNTAAVDSIDKAIGDLGENVTLGERDRSGLEHDAPSNESITAAATHIAAQPAVYQRWLSIAMKLLVVASVVEKETTRQAMRRVWQYLDILVNDTESPDNAE